MLSGDNHMQFLVTESKKIQLNTKKINPAYYNVDIFKVVAILPICNHYSKSFLLRWL